MQSDSPRGSSQRGENFVEALSAYSRFHRAQHWSGTFGEFLRTVVPGNARQLARSSHEYLWDMLNWFGKNAASQATGNGNGNGNGNGEPATAGAKELFKRELFGIDEPLGRIVDYFKAAAAGSDVGRRLLLLLGPPSGGTSTMAILLKRGLGSTVDEVTTAYRLLASRLVAVMDRLLIDSSEWADPADGFAKIDEASLTSASTSSVEGETVLNDLPPTGSTNSPLTKRP